MNLSELTIAVDFDGTCVDHRFPIVGPDVPGAVDTLRDMVGAGAKLILFTMRSDGRKDGSNPLSDAVAWFKVRDITLYGIQRNHTQDAWTSSPKAYAKLYIDDAAFGCPMIKPAGFHRPCVDWSKVRAALLGPRLGSENADGRFAIPATPAKLKRIPDDKKLRLKVRRQVLKATDSAASGTVDQITDRILRITRAP